MLISGTRRRYRLPAASAALGVLLVGLAGAPAYAESTREQQWHLDAMQAEQMWRTSTGEGITVAVVDTGVDPDNPDLKGRVLDGKDFAPSSRSGDEHTDYEGHGTGMAGLIAGTGAYGGGNGAFGLAPGAKILPIRMPGEGDVSPFAAPGYFSEAIRYAADAGAQVINISMGGGTSTPELTEAVRYALDKGSLIFAGTGNDGDKTDQVGHPAATPGVVGVAAVGKDLKRTSWSQFGPQVDVAAPGEDMVHACGSDTGLCNTHGTSDATALASASAALIWSEHPDWTNNQILRVMLNTIGAPTDGAERNDSIGYGIVRPRIALEAPGDPGPADEYPLPDLSAAEPPASPEATSPGDPQDDTPADQQSPAATATPSDDGNTPLWLALGAGAAVLAAAALTLVVRSRRQPATPAPPPPAPGQFGYPTTAYPPPPNAQSAPSDRYPPST